MIDSDDPDDLSTSKSVLFTVLKRYRKPIGIAALCWFGFVMAGGIFLSQLKARQGLHVFGPTTWVSGEPSVLRVTLRDLKYGRPEPLISLIVQFIDADGVVARAHTLESTAGPFVQGAITPPSHAGPWTLALSAKTSEGDVTAQIPIALLADAPTVVITPPKRPKPIKPDTGPVKLDAMPMDHVLSAGLPSTVVIRATDENGFPLATPVNIKVTEGKSAVTIPSRVITDHHGLARFAVKLIHPKLQLELSVEGIDGGEPSHAIRRLRHTNTQFTMRIPRQIVHPGERILLDLDSIHRASMIFVDGWLGAQWLSSTQVKLEGGKARVEYTVPTLSSDPALIWVQAYQSTYLPGRARAGRYLLVSRGSDHQAVRWLADQLISLDIDAEYVRHLRLDGHPNLARYLLGRLPRPDRDPPLLADSSVTLRHHVASLKSRWQSRFVWALLLTGLLTLGVLTWIIMNNHRSVQRAWIEAGGAEDGDVGTRRYALRDAAYVMGILLFFLLAMIQMLVQIHW